MNKKSQIESLQKEIARRVEAGESQSKIAHFLGVSPAYISQLRKGDVEKMSEQKLSKIAYQLGVHSQDWNIVATNNFNIVQELCDDAKSNCRMMAVSAFTGSGKTTALKDYARRNGGSVYYALMDAVMTRKRMLKTIQTAMGLEAKTHIEEALINICNALNNTSKPLLILDDVGKLSDANMRIIQIIYDNVEHRAGIVLSGTEYLKAHIAGQAEKDRLGFRELRSRIQYWQNLMQPTSNEVSGVLAHNGIQDERIIKHIAKSAREYRFVRNAATNLKVALQSGLPMNLETLEKLKISYHN